MKEKYVIGNPKIKTKTQFESKPIKKYRILIQERLASGNKVEKARSFMIYDFEGKTSIDGIKSTLQTNAKDDKKINSHKTDEEILAFSHSTHTKKQKKSIFGRLF